MTTAADHSCNTIGIRSAALFEACDTSWSIGCISSTNCDWLRCPKPTRQDGVNSYDELAALVDEFSGNRDMSSPHYRSALLKLPVYGDDTGQIDRDSVNLHLSPRTTT